MASSKKNRSPARLLSKVFLQSETPFYLVDPRGHIAFVNSAFTTLVQVPAEELLGQPCTSPIPDAKQAHGKLLALISLPPELFSERKVDSENAPWFSVRSIDLTPLDEARSDTLSRLTTCISIPLSLQDRSWTACWFVEQSQLAWKTSAVEIQQYPLHEQLIRFRQKFAQVDDLYGVLGSSPQAKRCRLQIQAAIACDQPVCIRGISGSSRREVAQAILSGRRKRHGLPESSGQLFPLECPLMDSSLLANFFELIESNSTRGSAAQKPCVLFVDVDRSPPETHFQILDFLRQTPGHTWMATSDRADDLATAFDSVTWNEIAHAIEVLQVDVPSLSTRPDDLPVIVESILHQLRRRNPSLGYPSIQEKAMSFLKSYSWPGDCRELVNALESATALADGSIEPGHLPVSIRTYSSFVAAQAKQEEPWDLDRILEDVERSLIERALESTQGNRASAARFLNISRARLLRRLEQLGMAVPAENSGMVADAPTRDDADITSDTELRHGLEEVSKSSKRSKSKSAPNIAQPAGRGNEEEPIEFTEIDFREDDPSH